jgi:hypothetical protein
MRLTRGRSASASAGLSAEGGASGAVVTVGFDSVGGGGVESTGGDEGATRDDGGGIVVIELEEEDSAFVDLAFFLACTEDAASSAITNEAVPMNFGDMKRCTLLCARPSGEPSLKKARLVRIGAGRAPASSALSVISGRL